MMLQVIEIDPWRVDQSWNVEKTEIEFYSDEIILSGTLYSPEGMLDGPALVVVQQANTETRDNSIYQQVARVFNSIGYSVFLYDRRGTGESGGEERRPLYTEMVQDAVSAKRAIKNHDAVHADKIGFWGISQGGWLAMEAATVSNVAYVISVSAPLTTPESQMETLAYNRVLLEGYGEDIAEKAAEARHQVMGRFFRGEISHPEAKAILASIEDEPWFEYTYMIPSHMLPENVESSSWIHEMSYDPKKAFVNIDVPLLFILGGNDYLISTEKTLQIIESMEPTKIQNAKTVVIPNAGHAMELNEGSTLSEAPEYFMIMGRWLGGLGIN
jgi:uncharacterized protein